jgi:peptidoglycan/xylan/chitin deacetylase (PgdA/CDA1 family)
VPVRRRLRAAAWRLAGDRGRGLVRHAALGLGLRPRVNRGASGLARYPGGRRAAVVISADLELAWAWRYAHVPDPLAYARQRARQGRRNLGVLLDLCDQHALPVTWATVGHLFLGACRRTDGRTHPELPRVPYFGNELWSYRSGDWFDADPASAGPSDPDWSAWYGPDLIDAILRRRAPHEIGCHSFSHAVFSDEGCPAAVAAAELRSCQEAAARLGLRLRSFVFPGNLAGNFATLRAAGFAAYRLRTAHELDLPRKDWLGMWQIPEGVWLEKAYASWTTAQHVDMLRRYLDAAVEHGLVCGLWFHPETDPRNVDEVFAAVAADLADRRSDVWLTTMGELACWFDAHAEYASTPKRAP